MADGRDAAWREVRGRPQTRRPAAASSPGEHAAVANDTPTRPTASRAPALALLSPPGRSRCQCWLRWDSPARVALGRCPQAEAAGPPPARVALGRCPQPGAVGPPSTGGTGTLSPAWSSGTPQHGWHWDAVPSLEQRDPPSTGGTGTLSPGWSSGTPQHGWHWDAVPRLEQRDPPSTGGTGTLSPGWSSGTPQHRWHWDAVPRLEQRDPPARVALGRCPQAGAAPAAGLGGWWPRVPPSFVPAPLLCPGTDPSHEDARAPAWARTARGGRLLPQTQPGAPTRSPPKECDTPKAQGHDPDGHWPLTASPGPGSLQTTSSVTGAGAAPPHAPRCLQNRWFY